MSYRPADLSNDDFDGGGARKRPRPGDMHVAAPHDDGTFQHEEPEEDGDDDDDDSKDKKSGRRKIKIEFIQDKSRRHITFSKRKAGIMKKAYELSTLTGTQVLLLVVSETGLVYTFTTAKLQPLVTQPEGKNLIQACLNAPNGQLPSSMPVGQTINRAGPQRSRGSASSAPSTITLGKDSVGGPEDIDDGEGSHSTGASPVNAPRQPQIPARRDNGSPQQSHQPYGLPPTQQYPPPPQQQSDSLYGHHQPPPSMLPYHMPQHPAPPPPASWAVPQQGYQRR